MSWHVCVNLHVAGKGLQYRAALHELPARLDPMRFVRVHRSALVNMESILQLDAVSHGEFEVVLKNGSRSRISRTYRAQLERLLGQSLQLVRGRTARLMTGGESQGDI
jgi:two-component system LytT family response regulator